MIVKGSKYSQVRYILPAIYRYPSTESVVWAMGGGSKGYSRYQPVYSFPFYYGGKDSRFF